MASINPKQYIINSDFPMPAQVSQKTATISISSGTSNGGASQATIKTVDINVGSGAQIFRLGIKSSRTNVETVGGTLVQYYNDGTFVAFFQNRGNGVVRCTVMITSGYDSARTTTSSANNFTFYLSSFKLP